MEKCARTATKTMEEKKKQSVDYYRKMKSREHHLQRQIDSLKKQFRAESKETASLFFYVFVLHIILFLALALLVVGVIF